MHTGNVLEYDYSIAKLFIWTTLIFGLVGMLVGVIIAFQMAYPALNYIAGEYSIFGRLRPIHTNGVIYGFTLSGIWAAWYYLGQRVLKITYKQYTFLRVVGLLHFWLYVILMIAAVISLFAGLTQSKEYAESETQFNTTSNNCKHVRLQILRVQIYYAESIIS